jgi:DNA-binding SARP family transcriptional activator
VLEFRILGPLEVADGATLVPLGGPKQRATLAILLLNANRVVSVERLADDLYSGAPPVTAVAQVQRQISELRKLLGPGSGIETRPPGYIIRLLPEQLDLARFEQTTERAGRLLVDGDARAGEFLREALALWRGAPLADLAYESFAQVPIRRLEELRLAAVEQRVEADLLLGRHREVVGELEELVHAHPLREQLAQQLMLALYRSERQAEALAVYRRTRDALVTTLGIEPAPSLRAVERRILAHDPALGGRRAAPERDRVVLVVPSTGERAEPLLALASPLVRGTSRELILARLVGDERELEGAADELNAWRASLGVETRTAALTSSDPAEDAVRLAATYDVELVLTDAPPDVDAAALPADVANLLERTPADVGLLVGSSVELGGGKSVFVPFAGGEHDWAALEVGAWVASATGTSLRLVGSTADPAHGRRDASRLLADASLAVQRVVRVDAAPILVEPRDEALVAAVASAALVVIGISPRWRREGIGRARRALVRVAGPPVLLVRGGPHPGGIAPSASRTRFTWSISG